MIKLPDQRNRVTVGIDGRQYLRKSAMYIDVLGSTSVSEAVQEASRLLQLGIAKAMAAGVEEDPAPSEQEDRIAQKDELNTQSLQTSDRVQESVYSAVTKRIRRANSESSELLSKQKITPPATLSGEEAKSASASASTGQSFRSWSAAKKPGPSILSKRMRPASSSNANSSVFQPGPKREKIEEKGFYKGVDKSSSSLETSENIRHATVIAGMEASRVQGRMAPKRNASVFPEQDSRTGVSRSDLKNDSQVTGRAQSTSKENHGTASKMIEQADIFHVKPQQGSVSSGSRKVGLPPAWSQVSRKSFNETTARTSSALAQLRKTGSAKAKALPAAPRGPSSLSSLSALSHTGRRTGTTARSGNALSEKAGVIPFPSTTGIKVQYVPGSAIIDGVRPNGYTVSITGVVKPVVTFNPIPKLPHKLRQNSVDLLFEALKNKKNFGEGEALASALRTEQEMYAKAGSRADYRAAATVKLKEARKPES